MAKKKKWNWKPVELCERMCAKRFWDPWESPKIFVGIWGAHTKAFRFFRPLKRPRHDGLEHGPQKLAKSGQTGHTRPAAFFDFDETNSPNMRPGSNHCVGNAIWRSMKLHTKFQGQSRRHDGV